MEDTLAVGCRQHYAVHNPMRRWTVQIGQGAGSVEAGHLGVRGTKGALVRAFEVGEPHDIASVGLQMLEVQASANARVVGDAEPRLTDDLVVIWRHVRGEAGTRRPACRRCDTRWYDQGRGRDSLQ